MQSKSNNLIVINFIGLIQERNVKLLESSIVSKQKMIKDKKIKGILVSLKGIIYENNQKDLSNMVKKLDKICQSIGAYRLDNGNRNVP